MSGKDAAPDKASERTGSQLGSLLLNGLFLVVLLYVTDIRFRAWTQYRIGRAAAWTGWGGLEGWRRLRRWWRHTSPWYQELLEQERTP